MTKAIKRKREDGRAGVVAVPKRTADTSAKVLERLREEILLGRLPSGGPLREKRLAREWGVGLTPVREAVRQLAACGFVVLRPNQAPLVRLLDARDIREIYDLREALEIRALEMAWGRIPEAAMAEVCRRIDNVSVPGSPSAGLRSHLFLDGLLHALWIAHCGNRWLERALDNLLIYRPNFLRLLKEFPQLVCEADRQHRTIFLHLRAGRRARTINALRHHIRHSADVLADIQQAGPDADGGKLAFEGVHGDWKGQSTRKRIG